MWQSPDPDFTTTVWTIVRAVPAGRVTTYGQIASMIPPHDDTTPDAHRRLAPRWVGTALRDCPDDVPWQRVINSQGKISLSGETGDRQRRLLESEDIIFSEGGAVDLTVFGWQGPDDAWLEQHDLLPPDTFGDSPPQQPSLL